MEDGKIDIPNICFGDPERCTYCGEPSTSIDHVIPVSYWLVYDRRIKRESLKMKGVITFACSKCNCILNDRMFPTFRERINQVQEYYLKKAKKYKGHAEWDNEEIAKLDHTLMSYVASKQEDMRRIDRQTTWIESISFRKCIKDLKYSSYIDPMSRKYLCWVREYFEGFV